jgi:hypothetical protein
VKEVFGMYSSLYKRILAVATSIILLNALVEVWVTHAAPFQTGNIWANWAVMSFVPVVGIGAVVHAYLDNADQKEMLGKAMRSVVGTTALAALSATLSSIAGVGEEWIDLIWAAFGANLFVGAISVGLIYVLVPQDLWRFRQYNAHRASMGMPRKNWEDFQSIKAFINV